MQKILTLTFLLLSLSIYSQRGFDNNDQRGHNRVERRTIIRMESPTYNNHHYRRSNRRKLVRVEPFQEVIINGYKDDIFGNVYFIQISKTVIGYDENGKYYLTRYRVNNYGIVTIKDYGYHSIIKQGNIHYLFEKRTKNIKILDDFDRGRRVF